MAAGGKNTLDSSPTLNNLRESIGGYLTYDGYALPGTLPATAGWKIRKASYDGSGNLTGWAWAGGAASFTNVWNNRAALSYS